MRFLFTLVLISLIGCSTVNDNKNLLVSLKQTSDSYNSLCTNELRDALISFKKTSDELSQTISNLNLKIDRLERIF